MTQNQKLRTFIAVEPESDIQQKLAAIAQNFNHIPWAKRIRWLPANNIHITMRFLGSIDPTLVETLSSQIEQVLNDFQAFAVTLTVPHLFPSAKRGRIIAALTHADEKLHELSSQIESVVVAAGMPAETRRFRGHITIGRSRTVIKNSELFTHAQETLTMDVNKVIFYQSILEKTGAQYVPLKTWVL